MRHHDQALAWSAVMEALQVARLQKSSAANILNRSIVTCVDRAHAVVQDDVRVCAYDRRGYGWYGICVLATYTTTSRDAQVVSSPLHQQ